MDYRVGAYVRTFVEHVDAMRAEFADILHDGVGVGHEIPPEIWLDAYGNTSMTRTVAYWDSYRAEHAAPVPSVTPQTDAKPDDEPEPPAPPTPPKRRRGPRKERPAEVVVAPAPALAPDPESTPAAKAAPAAVKVLDRLQVYGHDVNFKADALIKRWRALNPDGDVDRIENIKLNNRMRDEYVLSAPGSSGWWDALPTPELPASLLTEVAKTAWGMFKEVFITPTDAGGFRISGAAARVKGDSKNLFMEIKGSDYTVPMPFLISHFDRTGAYTRMPYNLQNPRHPEIADPLPDVKPFALDVLHAVQTADKTVAIEGLTFDGKFLRAVRRRKPVRLQITQRGRGVLQATTASGVNYYVRGQ